MLTELQRILFQIALDDCDIGSIDSIMPLLFKDYDSEYARTLVAYNRECDIRAADLVNYRRYYPKATFAHLFCFEPEMIKLMCRTNLKEYFAKISLLPA